MALPVAVAGLAEGNVAVGVFVAERMFLAALDILRPVAGSRPLVVQKSSDAELLGGRSVPASPVPRARSLVSEDAVEPVTVFGRDRRIRLAFAVAVIRSPRVIATLGDTAMLPGEDQTVWTVEELGAAVHAFPVAVAVLDIADDSRFRLARVFLLLLLCVRRVRSQKHKEERDNVSCHS